MANKTTIDAGDRVPALLTLDEALKPYPSVSVRAGREWIKRGRLPAVRVGKSYLVSPADLARLLTPTLRAPAPRRHREGERAKIDRQLAAAGIGGAR